MAKQTAKPKVKKKKWFPVLAPGLFREHVIGEILLFEAQSMHKRSLNVNMMNLTGNPRNQHINVILRISEVKDGKGMTSILGFEMMPSSIKRIVRRGRTKVGDSVIVATGDNKKVKIKPLLVSNTSVNKSVANSIRLIVRNALATFVSKLTYAQLVEEIMSFKLQKYLGNTAAKIAPIRSSEIRGFKLIEKEGIGVLKPVKMKTPVRERKEEVREEPKKEAKPEEKKEVKKDEVKKAPKKEEKAEQKTTESRKDSEQASKQPTTEVKPEEKKEEIKEKPAVVAKATEKEPKK